VGLGTWGQGGKALALSTLDLRDVAPAIRTETGEQVAQYLAHIFDRIGITELESLPDDPANRDVEVVFDHPDGRIALAPTVDGATVTWHFTPDTVAHVSELFTIVEELPDERTAVRRDEPIFFKMREVVHDLAPALTARAGVMEVWQWLVLLIIPALLLVLFAAIVFAAIRALRGTFGAEHLHDDRQLVWPLRIALTALAMFQISPLLGLPPSVNNVVLPLENVLVVAAATLLGWRLVDVLGHRFLRRPAGAGRVMDEIMVSLAAVLLRTIMVAIGVMQVASALSLPTNSLIAGLGISGIAVAFASKETLSNVFGAAILVADHPFRRGDWIVAGDVEGMVENVGVRSTRLRTAEDTMVVVPNGRLTDTTINNWGRRRVRFTHIKIPVAYGATPPKLDAFADGLRELVSSQPRFLKDRTQVGAAAMTENAVIVDLATYINVASDTEELAAKHALLSGILGLAGRLGLTLGPEPSFFRATPMPPRRATA
jgi:small-conductance mechanosensitive channel